MKKTSKVLLTMLCAGLLVVSSAMGTLAYLADKTEVVENTLTIGKVDIDLDEADVNEYGEPIEDADRVTENEYKLLPGHTYVKDPTVTVKEKSEPSYIRALVTVSEADMAKLKGAFGDTYIYNDVFLLQELVDGWENTTWQSTNVVERDVDGNYVYEFRYVGSKADEDGAVDAREEEKVLEPLFTNVVVPGNLTNTQIDLLDDVQINVIAHAMQKDTFDNADAAWAAWDAAGVTTYPTPTEAPTEAPVETPVEP